MEALHKHIKRFLPLHESSYTIVQASRVEGSKWTCTFKCGLASSKDIETFIDDYCEKNGETLRSASPKKCGPRSSMLINATLRCHHETRYGPTSDHIAVQKKKPGKRFKNTSCPYVMSIKLFIRIGLITPVTYLSISFITTTWILLRSQASRT